MAISGYVKFIDAQEEAFVELAAQKFKLDKRVISKIVRHPSLFLHTIMQDPVDERPVRFKYLGVFALRKNRYKIPHIELT